MAHKPHIIFAGAGPGDPGLVTMRLVEALNSAECILIDRLVNPEIITLYANKHAEIIFVGKQGYEKESTDQKSINSLLVQKALSGLKTVRLKGGDVAIYSNVQAEIKSLLNAGISYEIIPGITAASGAAASLGIALTGRDIAEGVQIHTMSSTNNPDENTLKHWATTSDTLVFYMSVSPLKKLIKALVEHEADPEMPLAIIEEATSKAQRTSIFTLSSFMKMDSEISFKSPSIIIIGKMIHQIIPEFLNTIVDTASVFNPINAITKNQTIHVI
ncbi:MAG: uroporphyrinogen-III C-methyltransferase [Saprospiraceae bacterium]